MNLADKTIRSLLLLVALFMLTSNTFSNSINQHKAPKLSTQAEISLMTCGPGEAVYAFFGHSALWVYDPIQGIDRIYNYGTFDFNDPNFYYLFVRGVADYRLSVTNFRSFMSEYIREERFVKQQKLNLTATEKQSLFDRLEENYLPENRYYRYDFFFLNCSSVIRDKVFETADGRFSVKEDSANTATFRDLLQPYLGNGWLDLGVNLLLSHKADKQANEWYRMFLPDHMFIEFGRAISSDGEALAPSTGMQTLNLSKSDLQEKNGLNFYTVALGMLFIAVIFLTQKKYRFSKWNVALDFTLFFLVSLVGILLTFMWLFSEHDVLNANINILWALPLHLFFAFLLLFKNAKQLKRWYAQFSFICGMVFYLLALIQIQVVPLGVILLASIILVRLARLAFLLPIRN